MNQRKQSLLNRCIMSLQLAGVKVTTERGSVTCLFPPTDIDFSSGAPDGNEVVYSESDFTLLVTRTFLELAEAGTIDAVTGEAVVYKRMRRCILCKGRVRPPKRPWSAVSGGVHFYRTTSDMDSYTKVLVELSKKIPFVHGDCLDEAEPDRKGRGNVVPWPYMIADNLNNQMKQRKTK